MNTTTTNELHTSARVFSVQGDAWSATTEKGKSIRIHGIDANVAGPPQAFDCTYRIGERAVYGRFNLIYTGTIRSITDKTVTIEADGAGERAKRLPLAVFVSLNRGLSPEAIARHNTEEMRCI